MAYIVHGSSNINYTGRTWSPKLVISSVVDSDCGPVSPRLIFDQTDLDIYFGRSFSQRNYFEELLDNDVALLLTKPMSDSKNTLGELYIDYSDFPTIPIDSFDSIPTGTEEFCIVRNSDYWIWENSEWTKLEPIEIKYISSQSECPDIQGIFYIDCSKFYSCRWNGRNYPFFQDVYGGTLTSGMESFIWKTTDTEYVYVPEAGYTEISILPQNQKLVENNWSVVNRDTLKIFPGSKLFCYPKYSGESGFQGECKSELTEELLEEINNQKKSFSFDLGMDRVTHIKDGDYFVFTTINSATGAEEFNYIFFGSRTLTSDILGFSRDTELSVPRGKTELEEAKETIKQTLRNAGYTEVQEGTWYYPYALKVRYFYSIYGFSFVPNEDFNNSVICSLILERPGLLFVSKTIGRSDSNIKISIEEGQRDDEYRVSVTRFGYTEVFEGGITRYPGIDRTVSYLPDIIGKSSKLVQISPDGEGSTYFTEWPIGEWELKGATAETYSPQGYREALGLLGEIDTAEDFLLVPDPEKFGKSELTTVYRDIFLEYAKSKKCQVLIENTESNFMKNYIFDVSNFLLYFYGDMEYLGNKRPGYYIFLKAFITQDYSFSESEGLVYSPPLSAWYGKGDDKKWKSAKSNFLVFNGQEYFYRTLYSENSYGPCYTTWLARFVMSKLSRTFQNEKWSILGQRNMSDARLMVSSILRKMITDWSGLVRNIDLVYFSQVGQNLNIQVHVYPLEMTEKDITLDITLNYNK
jgi:hypothetical protein